MIVPTEETVLKNEFINSLAHNNKFFILFKYFWIFYSYSEKILQFKWFININQSLDDKNKFYFILKINFT